MQDSPKTVLSISYISVVFFQSLKQNFIAYRSSKVSSRPDCILKIYQVWQSGFSRVSSNCRCSCSFKTEIIKISRSSYKIYSNNILIFQESTTILNACTKKVWKHIEFTTYNTWLFDYSHSIILSGESFLKQVIWIICFPERTWIICCDIFITNIFQYVILCQNSPSKFRVFLFSRFCLLCRFTEFSRWFRWLKEASIIMKKLQYL